MQTTDNGARAFSRFSWLTLALWTGLAATSGPVVASELCRTAALAGRYVGLDNGYTESEGRPTPIARLYAEDWDADGRIVGKIWERQGKLFRELDYTGQVAVDADCVGSVTRALPSQPTRSALVVSPTTHRSYSIDLAGGSTIVGTLSPQSATGCTPQTLKGVVLSTQAGFSLVQGDWKPNAVIQRETHDGQGGLVGVALSSYAGKLERGQYQGQFDLGADCTGSLRETDSQGNRYNYRVVVDAGGQGYYYLQTDPENLTGAYLGVIPRERP